MLISPDESVFILIDVQGELYRSMSDYERLGRVLPNLIKAMNILKVPVICTEQAPDKLGSTSSTIAELIPSSPIAKTSFSCWGNTNFQKAIDRLERNHVIIAGIETHVCVYQTAIDLLMQDYSVRIVCDAVSSRDKLHHDTALRSMEIHGCNLTTSESIICEFTRGANHPNFKEILSLIK